MSTPLTDEEIGELRRLDRIGSAAPWFGDIADDLVYRRRDDGKQVDIATFDAPSALRPASDDVLLIAAARNALPRLLDFAERARALLKRCATVYRDNDEINVFSCAICGADIAWNSALLVHDAGCELAALLGQRHKKTPPPPEGESGE